jgi:ribosome maturation factor RimP
LFTQDTIKELFESVLVDTEFALVELKVQGNPGNPKFVVRLDHRTRDINISELEKWSRRFEEELDISGDVPRKYALDVTSPGVGHPLTQKWEFVKNCSRELEIVLHPEEEGTKSHKFSAELKEVQGDVLVFENGEQVKLESVKNAKVKLPW